MSVQSRRKFSGGTYIFKEGDPGDCAYLLEKGQIQITIKKDGDDVPIALLGPGDIFGEMAIIDGMPRSASAFAMDDCDLSIVSRELFHRRVSESDPILRLLIILLLRRVRSSNSHMKGQSQLTNPDGTATILNFQEAKDRLKLENDLLKALQNKEFFLEYQPIFNLKSRELIGFEGLMRWQSPERGRVRPDLFIDAAEQTAVIHPMGDWCLMQGFTDLKFIQNAVARPELFMSLNVSVRQLNDPHFIDILKKAELATGINPKKVKLEVTERVFQEGPVILETMAQVRERGYSFSLDDFGTGYSSLTSLFNMKVDQVKIDRSFVAALTKDPKSKAIIQAIIAMAIELKIGVVAEGIEKEIEVNQLSRMGCLFGQGYLFSHPISVDAIVKRFAGQKKAS